MTQQERNETINAFQAVAEDLAKVADSIRALTTRNEVRGFYEHLTTQVQVPDGEDEHGNPTHRTLDPEVDRDVVIPGTRFTLGEVLDWSFTLHTLHEFMADNPGNPHESPGVLRRMYGFVTPSSTV